MTHVVVGGGISGILSALLLRERQTCVTLIEKEAKLGGLLSSVSSPDGDTFGYGTHYLVKTGHERIDALLFPEEWLKDWIPLPYLKAGNFFQGKLNDRCMFADTRRLPADLYERGVQELLAITTEMRDAANLDSFLIGTFGRTFTKAVFEPIVVARLGLPLSELYPNGHVLIGLNRIVVLDPETTRRLKSESPVYDQKIGFHSYLEGKRPAMSYYPRDGGTGVWIDLLERRLVERGVRIIKNAGIRAVSHESGRVTSVGFSDGSELRCDAMFWTLPVPLFLKLSGLPTIVEPPKIRTTSHFNYAIDRPTNTDLHYFLCNDPSKLCYRVTLPSNVQVERAERTGRHGVAVEVLSDSISNVDEASDRVLTELVDMGIIPGNARVLWKMARTGVSGTPVITPKFVEQTGRQMEALEGRLENAYFTGMLPGTSFFKKEVLVHAHDLIAGLG
jgi:protoporphyrinogen oxidase